MMQFKTGPRSTTILIVLALALLMLFVIPETGMGQTGGESANDSSTEDGGERKGINLLSLLFNGGWFMLPLLLLSGLIVAITIERLIALRSMKTIPPEFVQALGKMSMQNDGFDPRNAYRLCQGHPSVASRIVQAMLLKVGRPISEVESTVSDASQREADRLHSPIRWLELSAAVAPLIGLLGTVWGVTQAFYETTQLTAGQNKAAVLADGIYTALVTTICGLIIAIPAIVVFRTLEGRIQSIFHRIDEMMLNLIPQVERFEGQIRFTDPNQASGAAGSRSGSGNAIPRSTPAKASTKRPADSDTETASR